MRKSARRTALTALTSGVLAVTLVSGAYGAAPYSSKAIIKAYGSTCEIQGTFAWKNVGGGSDPYVEIWTESQQLVGRNAPGGVAASSGSITVGPVGGTSMTNYIVVGSMNGNGYFWDSSRTVTLRCR